ncbi:hypothetical protein GVN16_15690 [Emticicia sp. CRIBPO]|uniref:carboxypeptidase-like regulatory domain-containing protein n=1 Tax=Emticicia sp. CRIBPO TaxID=2683258 RepID=UPI001411CE47|nr:carboxypeptidase-like regulatory domain-containing protein [Emticicia sp. CRIBPO]NBA87215.1 hypothetical protein [Emticicia sp. CRIBPO]
MRLFLLIFYFLLAFEGSGQTGHLKISGRVSDSRGLPVEFANVYIHNTSSYCLTDTSGRFEIKIPAQLTSFDLIISRVGFDEKKISYKGVAKNISATIILDENKLLKEITVKAKQDSQWRKKWNIFRRALFGESVFSGNCHIENPEDVELTMRDKRTIVASTRAPLVIYNQALGYKIIISILGLETDGRSTNYIDTKYFIQLTPKDEKEEKKWNKNRLTAYKNSFRDFLVSMIENPDDERFEIYYNPEVRTKFLFKLQVSEEIKNKRLFQTDKHSFVRVNQDSTEFYFYTRFPLLVFLKDRPQRNSLFTDSPFEFSQMELPRRFLAFNRYGWINMPNGLFLHNYWGREGLADMLPYDYQPNRPLSDEQDPVEEKAFNPEEIRPRGFVRDTLPDRASLSFSFEKNQHDVPETDSLGTSAPINKPGYEVPSETIRNAGSISALIGEIPGIGVNFDTVTGELGIYFKDDPSKWPCLILNNQVLCDKGTIGLALKSVDIKKIRKVGLMNAYPATEKTAGAIIVEVLK